VPLYLHHHRREERRWQRGEEPGGGRGEVEGKRERERRASRQWRGGGKLVE